MILFRKLHKWLTLIIGVQLIVWLLTGTIISLIDQDTVSGNVTRSVSVAVPSLATVDTLFPASRLSLTDGNVRTVSLSWLLGQPIYRVVQGDSSAIFDARSGERLNIDKALAEKIARDSYRGNGSPGTSQRLNSGSDEVRDVTGPVWRIDFRDDLATRVYVSANDGQVLAHRNSRWKVVDFLLMLHFMDYFREDSFNNPQIIVIGFGTLWITVSGMLLIFYSFSRSDFLWLPGMAKRGRKVTSTIGADGQSGRSVELDASLSYYASLSRYGINLPSNCDGSGSCGLCKIRYESDVPEATVVDREWIGEEGLAEGLRLGCQHKPRSNDEVIVPDIALQKDTQWAEVVSSRWLTPLLKEIRIRPDAFMHFTSGDYLEFQVPKHTVNTANLGVPKAFSAVWEKLALPESWSQSSSNSTSRTYSIAVAPTSVEPQELVFNVRFAPPPEGIDVLPGVGSSYMCGLQIGDRVAFRGPAGDFRLVDSDREKIFIGGGAGMAPLKSMTLHLLENERWQGRLQYWYGARNQQEILYRNTLEGLASKCANFQWIVALSDASDDDQWQADHGFIHDVILAQELINHPNLGEVEFYVCGPPLMLAATRKMLRELGVADRRVRFDDFGN